MSVYANELYVKDRLEYYASLKKIIGGHIIVIPLSHYRGATLAEW